VWFGVLGPLQARDAKGEPIRLIGPARRQLLAALLCRAGRTVAAAALVEDLWGAAPPSSAAKTLQSHVAHLREDLGLRVGSLLLTDPLGYRLDVNSADFDAASFEDLIGGSRSADPEAALARLDSALGLWRGEAYGDFGDAAFAVSERLRLAELRALARERRTDLALELGQAASLVPDLKQRVVDEPYRERGWEQLVLALYRSGRQADALAAYTRARDLLAAELGVDPGPDLRLLEHRILQHDETLMATSRVAQLQLPGASLVEPIDCPYRGLVGYAERDAHVFAGRERVTAEVVSQLSENPVVALTGASGSGKSSLVRAGVVAALRLGALPGSAGWRISVVTPGELDQAADPSDLLVLDQAEELFTVLDESARAGLVDAVIGEIESGQRLLIVVRGDFYGRLAELPRLAGYAARATVLVGPMRDDELLRAIQQPARRVGVAIEPSLIEAVLDEAHGQAGALPMVSAALTAAWDRRESGALTLAGYRLGGGVARAIESTAERVFASLNERQQGEARDLLVRLSGFDRATGWVRRPLPTGDAEQHASPDVVRALTAARLVTVSAERVEISHEALLTNWPRLADWLAERAAAAELLDHVRAADRAWRSASRTDNDLYRGARLDDALDRRRDHPEDFSADEAAFLDASQAFAERELSQARQQVQREVVGRRRLRRVALALAAVVVLACAATVIAIQERSSAGEAALSADARKVAAEALTVPDLRTSLLLAAAAYRLQNSADTRSGLLSALERFGAPLYRIATENRVQWVGVNGEGSTVWAMDNLSEVVRFDTSTHNLIGTFPARADHLVAMSPDSHMLVAVGQADPSDKVGATRAIVLDATTGDVLHVLPITAVRDLTGDRSAAFTGDGHWLAVMLSDPSDPDTPTDTLAIFDARHLDAAPRSIPFGTQVVAVAAGDDRFAVQLADGELEAIDPASLRVVAKGGHPAAAIPAGQRTGDNRLLAMSPDGRRLAIAPGNVEVLDTANLSGPDVATQDVSTYVNALSFSPAGDLVAVGTGSGEVDVLHVSDNSLAARETGNNGQVMSVVWSGHTAQDETLYAGGLDSQIVAYTAQQLSPELRLAQPESLTDHLHLTPRYLVGFRPAEGVEPESHVQLWVDDPATNASHLYPLSLSDGDSISQTSFDRSGSKLLITIQHASGQVSCTLYDLTTGRQEASFVPTMQVSPQQTFVAALSPDARTAVVSVGDRELATFDLPSGTRRSTTQLSFRGPAAARTLAQPIATSPEGDVLVWGYDPGPTLPVPGPGSTRLPSSIGPPEQQQLELIDPSTGHDLGDLQLGGTDFPTAVAWAPNGNRVAVGTYAGSLIVLDATNLDPVAVRVPAASGTVNTAAFSPDGSTIITGSSDAEFSLWDAATGRPIGPAVRTGDNRTYAWFDSRGNVLGYAEEPGDNQEERFNFPGRADEWLAAACATAGRDLTNEEWDRYVTDRPYRSTCS
jgi:DNA-binding SARP family transcriptional activator/WD40 repeat protein